MSDAKAALKKKNAEALEKRQQEKLRNGTPNPWPKDSWMLPLMSREDAERLLKKWEHGTFLLRPLPGEDGPVLDAYVLSVVNQNTIIHNLIEKTDANSPFAVNTSQFGSCHTPESIIERLRLMGQDMEINLVRPIKMDPKKNAAHKASPSLVARGSIKLNDKTSVPCIL
eukprot:m.67644 g.67644  ORF g.67644 m.67644 type:complete len:169 (+) comp23852_c0_seq1:229-735(+)